MKRHNLAMHDIQEVIAGLEPLPGASSFLRWLQARFQVVILSDTFYQFATPLMERLGWPTLFCHELEVDDDGFLTGYRLRQRDQKTEAVKALKALNFRVIAAGDSYNDLGMLGEAHAGTLYSPPERLAQDYPQFSVSNSYEELQAFIAAASNREVVV